MGPQAGGFPVPNLPPAELLPTVALEPLLARVGRSAGKKFLVDARATQQIYLGGAEPNEVDYPTLLAILRNNGLAAIEIEGYMNVMPMTDVRFHAPIVQTDDTAVADDEWVTRIIVLTNVEAPFLVPILRPMLPQAAHLAALPPNKLIVMDRYANVRRITEIVRALDR
jgi:general secretion pathway protein D